MIKRIIKSTIFVALTLPFTSTAQGTPLCSSVLSQSRSIFLSHIVAITENHVMGVNNEMPWGLALKGDLERFKRLTKNHVIIMGRKTFESIGRPLPERHSIVITRDKKSVPVSPSVTPVESLSEAIKTAENLRNRFPPEVFVIGGGEIFNQTLPLADRLYLTIVHKSYQGTITYPQFEKERFKVIENTRIEGEIPYSFLDLERK